MHVKIKKLTPDVKAPAYAHPGDAGMDIYASEDTLVAPGETKVVKTGISMAVPDGFVALVWDKSGHAAKKSIKTMAGVIDSGYRGEVGIVMVNLGKENFEIAKNTKVAQILIQKIESPQVVEVDDLEETSRGEGGFGSTGLK
ncbi:dUTP diphosphatase [Nanoarchaeota archaeon]